MNGATILFAFVEVVKRQRIFRLVGPNSSGYTSNLDRAGVYTQSEIDSRPVYFSNNGVMPIPVETVQSVFKMTVIPTLVETYGAFDIGKHLETAVEY